MEAISVKLKELRQRKGFAQEQLANLSGLNLRTIQRIEKGETVPRGDSLQRLAQALKVTPDEIVDWQVREDKSLLLVLNLSQLSFLAFPILGILIPLIIWVNQKDKVSQVRELGIKILNYQITWGVFFFLAGSSFFWMPLLHLTMDISLATMITFVFFTYAFNVLLIVVNAVLIGYGKRHFFPAIRILR